MGFISTDLLVDGAVEINPTVGVAVVAAAAFNGIAVGRAYLLLFASGRHVSTVHLGIGARERVAVLILAAMTLGGGLFPQPGVTTRERAAEALLEQRGHRLGGHEAGAGGASAAPTGPPARVHAAAGLPVR